MANTSAAVINRSARGPWLVSLACWTRARARRRYSLAVRSSGSSADGRRSEWRRYLAGRGQDFREDASNTDRAIARNRLRLDLMPALEAGWPSATG